MALAFKHVFIYGVGGDHRYPAVIPTTMTGTITMASRKKGEAVTEQNMDKILQMQNNPDINGTPSHDQVTWTQDTILHLKVRKWNFSKRSKVKRSEPCFTPR